MVACSYLKYFPSEWWKVCLAFSPHTQYCKLKEKLSVSSCLFAQVGTSFPMSHCGERVFFTGSDAISASAGHPVGECGSLKTRLRATNTEWNQCTDAHGCRKNESADKWNLKWPGIDKVSGNHGQYQSSRATSPAVCEAMEAPEKALVPLWRASLANGLLVCRVVSCSGRWAPSTDVLVVIVGLKQSSRLSARVPSHQSVSGPHDGLKPAPLVYTLTVCCTVLHFLFT